MKKVISIHLNANAFLLEEEGYTLLEAYLNAAAARSKNSPDQADIMKEFEQLVADKCKAYLSLTKNVVLTDEIKKVISEMGSVTAEEDIIETQLRGPVVKPTHEVIDKLQIKHGASKKKLETSEKNISELSVLWDDFASLIGLGGVTLFFLLCWIVSAVSILLSSGFLSGTMHPFLSFLLVLLVTTCAIYVVYWPSRLLLEKVHKTVHGKVHEHALGPIRLVVGTVAWILAVIIFFLVI